MATSLPARCSKGKPSASTRSSKDGGTEGLRPRITLTCWLTPGNLREGEGGWTGDRPGRTGRLGRERRWHAGDPRGGGGRHRERGDLPGSVSLAQGAGSLGR